MVVQERWSVVLRAVHLRHWISLYKGDILRFGLVSFMIVALLVLFRVERNTFVSRIILRVSAMRYIAVLLILLLYITRTIV